MEMQKEAEEKQQQKMLESEELFTHAVILCFQPYFPKPNNTSLITPQFDYLYAICQIRTKIKYTNRQPFQMLQYI